MPISGVCERAWHQYRTGCVLYWAHAGGIQKASSRLLALLQARPEWSGDDLAGRLEVTVRTVRRDIDRLRALGYPVATDKGPGGGYRLRVPDRSCRRCSSTTSRSSLWPSRCGAPPRPAIAEDADWALAAAYRRPPCHHRGPPGPGVPPARVLDLLTAVSAAIQRREVLRLDYTPYQGAVLQRRRMEPRHLVASAPTGICWPGTSTATTGGSSAPAA
ncbi:helix-turn-helix transcriptional regulator [Streptomyces sp. NPDC001889]